MSCLRHLLFQALSKLLSCNCKRINHFRPDIVNLLKSLQDFDGAFRAIVKVRLFTVPSFDEVQAKIPYARVNHNKYMVSLFRKEIKKAIA